MISMLDAPKKRRRKFKAYDLEWYPATMNLRLVGVYDGKEYKPYRTMVDFLRNELRPKNTGYWYYAHMGGLADIQFVLEKILEDDRYSVEASFSGSSAVIVNIKRGNHTWKFVDSLFTIRAKLADIGELIGMHKGEADFAGPMDELIEYNEQDCKILWHAIHQFEDLILNLGSELQMTLASTAMRLIRRCYLKQDINTSGIINREIRSAYAGGRVEVFNRSEHSGFYYDINSCYPYAMTYPLPGNLLYSTRRLPIGDDTKAYIADLTIDVPKKLDIPPLPYPCGGSLYFPTGLRRSWLCGPEIELALELGACIKEIHKVYVYETQSDLADFATDIYGRRKRSSGYMKNTYKLILNAAYGKFGERPEKSQLLINPSAEKLKKAKDMNQRALERGDDVSKNPVRHYDTGWLHMICPGVFLVEQLSEVQHAHVPIAAYVTSYARVGLYRHLQNANPYYCDTDGFATKQSDLPVSDALGDIKLEKTYKNALFHAPKLYAIFQDGKDPIVRAKGFSMSDLEKQDMENGADPKVAAFYRLINGGHIVVGRMMRIRELYSKGILKPTEKRVEKSARFTAMSKRMFRSNGSSRPWTVDELHMMHKVG